MSTERDRRLRPLASGFTLVELMVVIAIIGLLASILATSVVTQMRNAGKQLDKKVIHDLHNELQMLVVSTDPRTRRMLATGAVSELRGREFYEGLFRHGLFDETMLPRLISAAGDDFEADRRLLDDRETFYLDPTACSWTGPQGNECGIVMRARSSRRRVVISANERNWFVNSPDVLTMWSDGEVAEYIRFEDLEMWDYHITPEQWSSPGEELFGLVQPFDYVFE
jgi:prepilin-type N-terminal cleavage/methylation domain-containing protein